MAEIVLDDVSKVYAGGAPARLGPEPRDQGRRVHRPRRPLGMRQDHRPPDGRGPRVHHRRHDHDRRPRREHVPPKERDIAMVFQNYALYPHMTVYDNMGFGLKLRKVPKQDIDRRVREAAKILGLEEYPRSEAESAVRRAAATRGDGPRDRPRAEGVPDGRAAVEPRRQAPRPDALGDRADPARAQRHDDLRHPRPGRGDDDGRPRRRDPQGRPPAGRHAPVPLRPPGRTCSSPGSSARPR